MEVSKRISQMTEESKDEYYQQYKANRIRPVSSQDGFVLYCSKQGTCTPSSTAAEPVSAGFRAIPNTP